MGEKKNMENDESPVPYLRRTRTAAILLSSLCWGLGISIPGLSLLELQRQVGVSLQEITLSLTARSIGHLIGSFASGFCYDRIENHFVLASALFGAGAVGAIIPWVQDYVFLLTTMAIWGVCTGYVDTGNNFLSLGLWGKKAGPVLQAGNMLVAAGGSLYRW
ncbi:sodium-dependent glucose transporter 1A-like [Ptychodera flava]|uniref:sodium-dependent glucose transporter 1A-like n=1 Tax=Ptychodera flava TaxID=63121 RepID=UPI003969FCDD